MENEHAFEADATVSTFTKVRSTDSRDSRRGHDLVQSAVGGFEAEVRQRSERSPLLGHRRSKSSSASGSSHGHPEDLGNGDGWDGLRDFDGLPWYKTPSIFWLLPAFLLFTLAFGATIVPKINLILALICRDYCAERSLLNPNFHMAPISEGGDNPQCQIPEVQALVSKFSLYGTLISGILSAIISPRLGALSDRYGRTRLMTASTCGMLIGEAITIVVAKYPDTFSVNWLLLGYFFDGLGGSFIAAMAVANAYASDCTPPTRRHVAFGYYHGCLFAGIALGPLLSGFVVKATGQILSVFYLAIAAHSVYTIWLLFIVPESLSKERQRTARKKFQDHADAAALSLEELDAGFAAHFLPMGLKFVNVLSPLSVLWPNAPGTNPKLRYNLVFLAAVDTTLFGVAMGAVTIVLLYSEFMFDWGNFETSIFVAIVNSCRVTILIVVLPLITRLLRGPASRSTQRPSGSDNIDLGFIRISIIFDILGFVGYSTVREGWLFILSGAIASVGGMGSPTLSAGLTKHVPPDQTGKVLGAMGLLHAMARLVGPIVFNLIYAKTVKTMPQTVFICLAATFGLALIFSLLIRPNIHWDEPYKSAPLLVDSENPGASLEQDEDPQESSSSSRRDQRQRISD